MRRVGLATHFELLCFTMFLVTALSTRPVIHAQTAPNPAATPGASAGGSVKAMEICFSNPPPNPSDLNYKTEYLTAAFEVPVDTLRPIPVLEPAFSAYLKATYHYPSAGITCQPIWSIDDAQQAQKKIAGDRDRAKLKMIDTGWRYGQSPLVEGQGGFDPLALGRGGIDLSQHRLTTYFCSLTAPGGTTMAVDMSKPDWNANMTTYVSPVFQADWDSAPVSMAYNVYIRDHYVHDLTLSDLSPRCSAQSPAMQAMQHQTAMISNKRIGKAVLVDFTYTAAQAAAAHAPATPAAQPPSPSSSGCRPGDRNPSCSFNQPQPEQAAHPTTSSAGGPFISCSTSGGAGIVIYLTGIFQTTKPVRHLPNGAKIVDQSVLDDFYAYLTQKGYNFKPGSNGGCDVSLTEAAATAAQHTRVYGGSGSCGYCGAKVVETGWKDE